MHGRSIWIHINNFIMVSISILLLTHGKCWMKWHVCLWCEKHEVSSKYQNRRLCIQTYWGCWLSVNWRCTFDILHIKNVAFSATQHTAAIEQSCWIWQHNHTHTHIRTHAHTHTHTHTRRLYCIYTTLPSVLRHKNSNILMFCSTHFSISGVLNTVKSQTCTCYTDNELITQHTKCLRL